jgi:hypothetical protein
MSDFLDFGAVNQRIAAFDRLHGASIFHEGFIRFEDGACREANPLGVMVDPPADPWDRAKRVLMYRKIIFQRAVRAFDQAKQGYAQMAQAQLNSQTCGPAPAMDFTTSELKRLQSAARAAKRSYDKAVAAVEAATPAWRRNMEAQNVRNRADNEALLNSVRSIEI